MGAGKSVDAQSRDVPFTLDDRDRAIRMEEKLNSQQQQISDLKVSTQEQISGLKESINDKNR